MTADSPPAAAMPASRRPLIGFILGAMLLGAAAWVIVRQGHDLRSAINSALHAPWWLIALCVLLPLCNWLLMSASFWVLMRRYGEVALGEMACLVGTAWLLNYLPLRPGLVGRVGYHKAVNKIPVACSVAATMIAIVCSGIAIVSLLSVLALGIVVKTSESQVMLLGAIPLAVASLASVTLRTNARLNWVPVTLAIRYLDLLFWAARYCVAFAIIGHPISPAAAGAIACVCQIAMLVPFFGNGLGLREWAVGFSAASLPKGLLTASGALATTVGLSADLINRAAEIIAAVPVGLICAARLSARLR